LAEGNETPPRGKKGIPPARKVARAKKVLPGNPSAPPPAAAEGAPEPRRAAAAKKAAKKAAPAAKKATARKATPAETPPPLPSAADEAAGVTVPSAQTEPEPAPPAPEGGAAKKATAPKPTAKKGAPRKAATRKATPAEERAVQAAAPAEQAEAALRPPAERAAAKKPSAKKATAKKAAAKTASAKKATAKKATARTTAPETAATQMPGPETAAAQKAPAKKAPAKKAPAKTTSADTGAPAQKAPAAKKATTRATTRKAAAPKTTTTPAPLPPEVTRAPAAADEVLVAAPAVSLPDPASVDRSGWLASYPPGVPESYDYPLVPLTRFLDDAAQDFPDTQAIEFLGYTLTYRQLLDQVDRFASALHNLGVGKGDRVGLILPNCPQHVIAIFATLRLGAVVAENNPLYTEAELEHQLNDAGCKVVVCLDPIYAKLAALKGRLPSVEHIIATGIQDALPFPKNLLFPLKGRKDGTYVKIPPSEGVKRFTELIAKTGPTVPQAEVDPGEDLAMLVYTGGTTGVSKGVMLTHFNLVANAFQGRLWMPDIQAGRENVLCVMPFFHSYGLTTCLTLGVLSAATLTLLPRFERDTVLKTIDKRKPTLFPGVPTIYVALNNAPDVNKYDLSSIRACLSGAAPLPVEVATQFEQLTGGKLREGYGLTETSPITHANPIYGKAKKGHIGLPVTDTVCVLVDLEDPTKVVGPGETGELAIAGPQVMRGYWNRHDETEQVLKDGWLLTGDVAVIDDEGYFAIVDRKKDMIIAGGYNIYPRDIEEVLFTHPKVEKAVVAGIPDPYRGETVKAYVVLKAGQTATAEEIDGYCRERLAAYKVPKAYEFRDALPETMVGKVLRRKLVEEEQAKASSSEAVGR
jgi:long-chain acyl-CoA synthetase